MTFNMEHDIERKMNVPENKSMERAMELDNVDYLRGVESSTCLLLPTTPSPSPMDFKHPLSEEMSEPPFLNINDNPKIIEIHNSADACAGDSSSSADSNSVLQDPISAQLINNISMLDYQTLSKNGDIIVGQPEGCKLNGSLSSSNRKLPNFVNWNWPLIRVILFWFVLSGLIACLGAIVAMVITIPKKCNPDLPWYQGKVFYEIFPASFKDSNNDGIGDLKGLVKKLDYIKDLGGSAIRMNYIFEASNYPEEYFNTTSLLNIDRSVGTLKDFQDLLTAAHAKQINVVLDIPVLNMIDSHSWESPNISFAYPKDILSNDLDPTSAALGFWARAQNVDGFYLKNLEKFVNDSYFAKSLQYWKHIIGNGKIFIASEVALKNVNNINRQVFLNRIDLVDVHLNLENGISGLKNHIDTVVSGCLWEKPFYPWIHWNIGSLNSERIATRYKNNSLALLVMEMVLPGTVSLFYGDEIGLSGHSRMEIEGDFLEHKNINHLVPMIFSRIEEPNNGILPWNMQSDLEPKYNYYNIIKDLIELRLNTPTIYLRAIYKDGNVMKNMEIHETEENLVVIERWYPRRNTCVFVGNLGNIPITTDLSTMFYGGTVVGSTNTSLIGQIIYFDKVTFLPNSAIILKLEK